MTSCPFLTKVTIAAPPVDDAAIDLISTWSNNSAVAPLPTGGALAWLGLHAARAVTMIREVAHGIAIQEEEQKHG